MTALLWTAVGTALAIALAWRVHTGVIGWLPEDDPRTSARKRHAAPIPLAGFLPGAACLVVLGLQGFPYLAGGCGIALAVGFLDDRSKREIEGMRARTKGALLLVAAATAALPWLLEYGSHAPGKSSELLVFVSVVAVLFVLTNAANFLDNLNGVTTGLTVLALAWIGTDAANACIGAWLAFLPCNWPRGRLFLGDSGALTAGLLVGGLTLHAATHPAGITTDHTGYEIDWLVMFAPTAFFFLDFVQVVTARIVIGYPPWISDRRHLTHIAQNVGVPTAWIAPLSVLIAAGLAWAIDSVS